MLKVLLGIEHIDSEGVNSARVFPVETIFVLIILQFTNYDACTSAGSRRLKSAHNYFVIMGHRSV